MIGFLMMPFLVSHLGDRWYGIWTAVGSLAAGYYLLDLGLSTAVTRFVTESLSRGETSRASAIVSTAFAIYSVLGFAVLALTGIAAFFAAHFVSEAADVATVKKLIIYSGASLAIGFPFKAFAGLIQARLRYDLLAFWHIGLTLFLALLTVVLIKAGLGVLGLAYVAVAGTLLSDVIFALLSRRLSPDVQVSWRAVDFSIVRELFGFSSWAFLIHLAEQFRTRIDSLVVGALQSASAVTHYAVGARLAETAINFLYSSLSVIQPVLTRYHALDEKEKMRAALLLFTRINAVIGFFVLGMLLILGDPFIQRWMGPEYTSSPDVLYVIAIALSAAFLVYPMDNSLYAVRKHRMLAFINIGDAVVNVALSLVLGRHMGSIGVALGTMIPMVISRFAIVVPYACRQTGIPLREYYGVLARVLLIACLVLGPTAMLAPYFPGEPSYESFAAITIAAAIVYVPAMFLFAFPRGERAQLQAIWGR